MIKLILITAIIIALVFFILATKKQKDGGALVFFDDENIGECPKESEFGVTLEVNLETGETKLNKNKE
jgi:hypothetical protein